jgi:hypothetical protein
MPNRARLTVGMGDELGPVFEPHGAEHGHQSVGWSEGECDALGYDFADRRRRADEALLVAEVGHL